MVQRKVQSSNRQNLNRCPPIDVDCALLFRRRNNNQQPASRRPLSNPSPDTLCNNDCLDLPFRLLFRLEIRKRHRHNHHRKQQPLRSCNRSSCHTLWNRLRCGISYSNWSSIGSTSYACIGKAWFAYEKILPKKESRNNLNTKHG
jgi:hypothetical protein